MLGLERQKPVLLVIEDAHWIDPTTLELLGQVVDRFASARILMLLTSRPDNQPDLRGFPHLTCLVLNRLGRGPTEAIVARLSGGKNLPAAVLEEIAARSDGVPLFTEELTKAVLEAGPTAAVPASLYASLLARLDRVPGVREVAQVAACIGREFGFRLIGAVSPLQEGELQMAWTVLWSRSWYSATERHLKPVIRSNTRWFATPRMKACSRRTASKSMARSFASWRRPAGGTGGQGDPNCDSEEQETFIERIPLGLG
ncbi:ATP-binding protein [Ensifer aridi]|uniref:ATP-binding protein n=1 Tax=Ensifer aridi TaxID=1708715 RepID=UPI00047BBE60|nr:ATP-binding protein [Ensifer aridi]